MIVGHDNETRAELPVEFEHQAQHVLAVARIQVAGRLIGQHQLRPGDERPRDRCTLALAAGQFPGLVCQPLSKADTRQQFARLLESRLLLLPPDQQWHGDVLFGRELGQQVMELVDEADVAIAQIAFRGLVW